MNTTTAINAFARAVVRERRIPFEIFSPQAVVTREGAMQALSALRAQARENGISNMTMDEINEEIRQYRDEAEK